MPEMSAHQVIAFYQTFQKLESPIWIDGGWGVDALLGEQTRSHRDLDIVIEQHHVAKLTDYLLTRGFRNLERDDTSPWNFVVGDDSGLEIDFHVVVFDEIGNGLYGPSDRGVMYPAGSLEGRGSILGVQVKCVAPEFLVAFHTGYQLAETDIHDVTRLCKRFGISLPLEYRELSGKELI